MGLKVAGISILCQDIRVFNGLWMAGSPCPFMGKIGDAARDEWIKYPEKSPEGSIIRVEAEKAKKVARIANAALEESSSEQTNQYIDNEWSD